MRTLFFILLLSQIIRAQGPSPSNTFIKTCYHNASCFSSGNAASVFYSENKQSILIIVDFKEFKTGIDSLDEWLLDLEDTKFIFKGHLAPDKLLSLNHHNFKIIHLNGKIKFNNIIQNHNVDIALFEISKEGILYTNLNNDYYDRIRANIQIVFSPKEFKLNKKKHHLKKTIYIDIGKAYINPLKPEYETFIDSDF